MKAVALIAVAAVVSTLSGCIIVATDRHYYPATKKELEEVRQVQPGEAAPSVRTVHQEQISKLTPGTTVEGFKGLFPQALFVEQQETAGHKLDAYSVKLAERYHIRGENVIQTSHDEAWFYFKDGQYVKWGEPKQWP